MEQCRTCGGEAARESFITSTGKRSGSCLACRVNYVKLKEMEKGIKKCYNCHTYKSLEEYKNNYNGNEYISCHNCRVLWYNANKKK